MPIPPTSTTPTSPRAAPAIRARAANRAVPRPPSRLAEPSSGDATAPRNSHAPGLTRTARAPRATGGSVRCSVEPLTVSPAERMPSTASQISRAPPATRRTRKARPLGAATDRPRASDTSSVPKVALAPARACNPRGTPPRTASPSKTACTGPGALARATPSPSPAITGDHVSAVMSARPRTTTSPCLASRPRSFAPQPLHREGYRIVTCTCKFPGATLSVRGHQPQRA